MGAFEDALRESPANRNRLVNSDLSDAAAEVVAALTVVKESGTPLSGLIYCLIEIAP